MYSVYSMCGVYSVKSVQCVQCVQGKYCVHCTGVALPVEGEQPLETKEWNQHKACVNCRPGVGRRHYDLEIGWEDDIRIWK